MASIPSRDTVPEVVVRRMVWSMGYRYRLHREGLPGTPDLAFIGRKKVIFVNGCFWHGHACKQGLRVPDTHREYWVEKIQRNKARDATAIEALGQLGWSVLTIWECELHDPDPVRDRLRAFLDGDTAVTRPRGSQHDILVRE